jgi:hypothetical protein
MLRHTPINTLTGKTSRHPHPAPFVLLSLGGRNNVEFGRVGDMVSHHCSLRRFALCLTLQQDHLRYPGPAHPM